MSGTVTDRRFFPANERVAHVSVAAQADGRKVVEGVLHSVSQPVVNLLAGPGGALDRQLLFGAAVEVLEVHNGFAFVRNAADGYVGYVGATKIRAHVAPTHRIASNAAQVYPKPDIKSTPFLTLPYRAELAVDGWKAGFAKLATGGHVPEQFVQPISVLADDPVETAERFLGAPYLWGGNSIWGLDCSGLVQAAFRSAGTPCPADSDLQQEALGVPLPPDDALQRGDLVFWKGHVGIMQSGETLLHANAHHMTVTSEPLAEVTERIAGSGGGEIAARKRVQA